MGTAKAILRGKFMAIQSYLKKQEKSQMNKLMLHIKQLDKEEQAKPKVSRRKEIIMIRVPVLLLGGALEGPYSSLQDRRLLAMKRC